MSSLQVSLIQDAIPDFWTQNYEFFTNEDNLAVLNAMENLQDEIVKFEHMLVLLLSFLFRCLWTLITTVFPAHTETVVE